MKACLFLCLIGKSFYQSVVHICPLFCDVYTEYFSNFEKAMELCKYLKIIKVYSRNFTANSAAFIPDASQATVCCIEQYKR